MIMCFLKLRKQQGYLKHQVAHEDWLFWFKFDIYKDGSILKTQDENTINTLH